LMELEPGDNNYLQDVYRIAQQCPSLVFQLVKYATNTIGDHAHTTGITDLRHAIARLGAEKVAGVAATLSLKKAVPPGNENDRELWVHTVLVAVTVRELTAMMPLLSLDPEQMYTAGILHDIGRFVAFQALPQGPSLLSLKEIASPESLVDTESAIFGADHVKVSVDVCNAWEMPSALIEIIEHHHDESLSAQTADERKLCRKVCLLQIADHYSMWLSAAISEHGVELLEEKYRSDRNFEEAGHQFHEIVCKLVEGNCQHIPKRYTATLALDLLKKAKSIYTECRHILKGLGVDQELPELGADNQDA
jgi:putative nucleotidyltransferase with HDIG domain